MSAIQVEIDAYDRQRAALERDHLGQWVVIHDCEVVGYYSVFESAADDAVQRFGSGPFLIRQIGAAPVVLPASVMFTRMPTVSCGYSGTEHGSKLLIHYGATLRVSVGFDPLWKQSEKRQPKPGISSIEALIDTGAQESCIDSLLAEELGLPTIDRRTVCGVGKMEVDVRLGQIHVEALRYTIHGGFSAVPLTANGHPNKVLLGRTFLRACQLVYDGKTGSVTIQLAQS